LQIYQVPGPSIVNHVIARDELPAGGGRACRAGFSGGQRFDDGSTAAVAAAPETTETKIAASRHLPEKQGA
jgi:hypothetical protein